MFQIKDDRQPKYHELRNHHKFVETLVQTMIKIKKVHEQAIFEYPYFLLLVLNNFINQQNKILTVLLDTL